MKKTKKVLAAAMAAAMVLGLAACGSQNGDSQESDTPSADKQYKVGIIQQMEHVALDGAREGFVAALADKGLVEGENLTINYQNGNGDPNNLNTIAEQFVSEEDDLVLAIATTAARPWRPRRTLSPL